MVSKDQVTKTTQAVHPSRCSFPDFVICNLVCQTKMLYVRLSNFLSWWLTSCS